MSVGPEETERVTSNEFTTGEGGLLLRERRIGIEPSRESSLAAAVRARAEPTECHGVELTLVAIRPVQFHPLPFADDSNGAWARFALHTLSLRVLRKRPARGGYHRGDAESTINHQLASQPATEEHAASSRKRASRAAGATPKPMVPPHEPGGVHAGAWHATHHTD